MQLDDILSIGGKPGLFKLVKATRQGVLVESLLDGKRMPVSQRADVSALKDIAIYTLSEEKPLPEVLASIGNTTEWQPVDNPKKAAAEDLKNLMLEVLPDYDEERVYVSHLKKVFSWYNLLLEKEVISAEAFQEEADPEAPSSEEDKNTEKEADAE
jgi:hypothetical protein